MAIATTTAAAIAAGVGMAATAATTTMSFMQAGKQRQAQRQAERDADKAMADAKKKLEVNFYGGLGIQKEPYELEREALLSQGAQAIQAGVESERGAAPMAGRVMLAQQQGQAGVRTAMGQELSALEKLSAQEQSRLRDVGVNLDLGEVEGAQLAAANAQKLAAQSNQAGLAGVVSLGQQAAQAMPLFASQSTDALGNAITLRPESGQYALNTAAMKQQKQNQKDVSNFYSNPYLNPFAQFYQNPSIGGQ